MYVSAVGIPVCFLTSFFATNIFPVKRKESVERVLKVQLLVSTLLMTIAIWPVAKFFLPSKMHLECDFAAYFKENDSVDATGIFADYVKALYDYDTVEATGACKQSVDSNAWVWAAL